MTDEHDWIPIVRPRDRRRSTRVAESVLPQQETLENIVMVVRHHDLAIDDICDRLISNRAKPVDKRIVGYYRSSARLLGFLDREHIPTPSGRVLLQLAKLQQVQRMAHAFEASTVGQAWLEHQKCRRLEDIDPSTALDFAAYYRREYEKGNDDTDTVHRRASTLRAWLGEFVLARQQLELPYAERRPKLDDASLPSKSQVVFDSKVSRLVVRHLAQGSTRVDVASAYFSLGGYQQLAECLDAADVRLLVGNDERSGDDIRFLLKQFSADLEVRYETMSTEIGARRATIRQLHAQLVRGQVKVRRFEPRHRTGLHAKVYIFDNTRAYLGSANLTMNGLASNVECGHVVCEREDVEYLADRFERYFDESAPFGEPLMKAIEESWALWDLADPQLVLLKILDILLGRVQPIEGRRFQLAQFQRAIVATLERRFESQDRVLLIAPTGIGKTVMGACLAASMRNSGKIERVVLVCKNQSMRAMWTDVLRDFRIYNDQVRTYDLERTNPQHLPEGRASSELNDIFCNLGPRDLIIVDECHHYRRDEANRQIALNRFLDGPSPEQGGRPKALLMTATPISTGIENLQTLLDMVSSDVPPLQDITDVATHSGAVNVSLGQVLRDFGETHGTSIGLSFEDGLRYFPKIDLRTIRYTSDMDTVFAALEGMDFSIENQWGLGDFIDEEAEEEHGRHGFIRALIARRAESSLVALTSTLRRLEEGITLGRIKPSNPIRFTEQLERLQELADRVRISGQDRKFRELLRILRRLEPGTKLIIFTEYRATADFLHDAVQENLTNSRVAKVTGDLGVKERRSIFAAFAPNAQGTHKHSRERFDVLVATDAISEGENLQDAERVINYDLGWTPLRLIQRIGRVNRFTTEPRTIRVANFFPGAECYERIVRLRGRLQERGQQILQLSGVEYLEDGMTTPASLARREERAVVELLAAKPRTLTWAELVDSVAEVPSAAVPAHLWRASASELRAARALPYGVQSCGRGRNPGLLVLLRLGRRYVTLFRDDVASCTRSAPLHESHEVLLRLILDVRATAPMESRMLDREIGELVQQWISETAEAPTEVAVLAALRIIP